jgi:hypothetical protein
MERLWAPWRIAHLYNPSREKGCIFCNARDARGEEREHLVLSRSGHSLTMISRYSDSQIFPVHHRLLRRSDYYEIVDGGV